MLSADALHLLRVGLDVASPPDTLRLDADRGADLLAWAVGQRCVGLLAAAVAGGAVVLPGPVAAQLADAQLRSTSVALALERLALDSARRCEQLGVPFKVLKGVALAHTVYPEPEWRDFGDVDLLVPADGLDEVTRSLEADGARRVHRSLGRSYERLVGKGVTIVTADGWELDLHRSIVHGPWASTVDIEDLWDAPDSTFSLGGTPLPTLSVSDHLVHALLHAALGSSTPRSNSLRDVAQLQLSPECNRDRVLELLDRWSASAPAAWAASQVGAAVGVDTAWLAADREPTRRERRWLQLHRNVPQSFRRLTLESVVRPIGARRRAAVAVAAGAAWSRSVASTARTRRRR